MTDVRLPEHLRGDGPCSNCETLDNIVWFTDSVFWNAVVRVEPRLTDNAEILCITCFVVMADQRGYRCNWRLTPEFHWETKAEAVARTGSESPTSRARVPLCGSVTSDPGNGREYRCVLDIGHAPASDDWPHKTYDNVLFQVSGA